MELIVGAQKISAYNQVNIRLRYNDIADTFSFRLYFNEGGQSDRDLFKPLKYQKCTITHGGVTLMTGRILKHSFKSAGNPPKSWVEIGGYSETGVLGEACRTLGLEQNAMTLRQIAEQLCVPFGISVVVDSEVSAECNTIVDSTNTSVDQTIADYLNSLAQQLNVVLSHTTDGNLLLTRAKADRIKTTSRTLVNPTSVSADIEGAPDYTQEKADTQDRPVLHNFTASNGKWLEMELSVDGQKMFSDIYVVGEQELGGIDYPSLTNKNVPDGYLQNPNVARVKTGVVDKWGVPDANGGYSKAAYYRPKVVKQTQGDVNTVQKLSRAELGKELTAVSLIIKIQGWTLGGNLVTPNQIITVTNPDLYLYKETSWFINEVIFFGDEKEETATLVCVPVGAFGNDPVNAIF